MSNTILVGAQFGDEGKGKVISHLALHDQPEIIARGGVGPNAGHEVHYQGKKYPMRMMSCGFVYDKARILIGAGVVVNPDVLLKEIEMTSCQDRLGIDKRCTLITKDHLERDAANTPEKIGSTKTGCGPAVMDRAGRTATFVSEDERLKQYLTDVPKEIGSSNNVLIEGSQGFMLSVLYGTYPYVTSKDTSASTIAADVGIGPTKIDDVIIVMKAYTTRVGGGPFKNELPKEEAEKLGIQEYGTVTGRPRRSSSELHWEDLKYAAMINGATQIAVTKLDIKFQGNAGVRKFDDLTKEAQSFVKDIESKLGVDVTLIGTGPDALDIIDRRK